MTVKKEYTSGIVFALINTLCLGIVGIVDKVGNVTVKSPLAFSIQSMFFALIFTILVAVFFFRDSFIKDVKKITPKTWVLIIGAGFFGSGLSTLFRFLGLIQSTGTFASLSQVVITSLTVLLAQLFLRELLPKNFWKLFIVIIGATYFVSIDRIALINIKNGDTFILFATIFVASANIFSRKAVEQTAPIIVSVGRFICGLISLLLIGVIVINRSAHLSSFTIWAILSGFLWSACVVSFTQAIKKIGVIVTTSILMTAPVITILLEYLLLNYTFTSVQIIAAFTIIVSGIILIRQPRS